MTTLESRVTTVPFYPALATALQQDMLATALILRDALYDIKFDEFRDAVIARRIEEALITLDFPHFVPIADHEVPLMAEYARLKSMLFEDDDIHLFLDIRRQFADVKAELERRGHIISEDGNTITKPIVLPDTGFAESDCDSHFPGGWYYTTDKQLRMAVPPHMGVDADKACPKCRGWLSYPAKFSHWHDKGGES